MAKVDLRVNIRDENGKLYRAGKAREVPDELAERLNLEPLAAEEAAGDDDAGETEEAGARKKAARKTAAKSRKRR